MIRRAAVLAAAAWLLGGVALAAPPPVGPATGARAALEAPLVYEVQPRDTLIGIASRYLSRRSDYRTIQRLNRIRNPRRMQVGAKLDLPYGLLKSEPLEAVLVAFRGAVTVTPPGGAAAPAARDMKLREGYALATAADAFLTIEFEDGSRTTLPSRSRLVLQRLRKIGVTGQVDRILRLEEGRTDSVVQHLPQPKDRFVITTPVAVSAVRGTRFRVGLESERALLEVVEGRVASTPESGQGETEAAAGFGVITAGDGPARTAALLPPPKLQNPGRMQTDAAVAFQLDPTAGAHGYRAQLATDGGFVDLIAETTSATPALGFPELADGDYFIRFTADGEEGLRGMPATYAFERRMNTFSGQPPGGEGGRRYRFRWNSAGGGVASFRFQLAAAPDGTPLIDEPGLDKAEIVVTDLPPGTYYWRVLITRTQNGRQLQRWSDPERFEIGQ